MRSTSIRRQVLRQFENGRGLDRAVPRGAREKTIPRAIINVILLCIAVFAAAFLARHVFFLDVRPVSWGYTPPETWSLQAAFSADCRKHGGRSRKYRRNIAISAVHCSIAPAATIEGDVARFHQLEVITTPWRASLAAGGQHRAL
jgi:hypothetical protein